MREREREKWKEIVRINDHFNFSFMVNFEEFVV